jgi:hypothetical protein
MPEPGAYYCSVCIANYNGMGFIDACVESVLTQDCPFPVEIIVHDDASTDMSAAHIRARWPDVTLIASPDNVGFCIANNRMAAIARGRYLLLLNNDATLFPDALRSLAEAAERLGVPAILGLPQYDDESGRLIDVGSLFDAFLNTVPNLDRDRRSVGTIIGACLWLPRTLWQELGGFPEWFGSLAEDTYLCCLARLRGHPVQALGHSGFRHRVGASLGGGKVQSGRLAPTGRRRYLSERNKTCALVITYPSPILQIILPVHVLLLAIEGLAMSLAHRAWRPWLEIYGPSLADNWRLRTRLLRLRAEVQQSRRIDLGQWLSVFRPMPRKLGLLLEHGIPELR